MILRPLAPLHALSLSALLLAPVALRAEGLSRVGSIELVQVPGFDLQEAADIAIRGDAALEYTLFRLQNPARVVLDLPGADVGGLASPAVEASPLVKSVTTSQFKGPGGDVARVVVQLTAEAETTAARRGEHVVLSIRRSQAEVGRAPAPRQDAPSSSTGAVLELVGDSTESHTASKFLGVTARPSGEASIVEIATDGPVQRYEMEEVENPARLVVDLYDVAGPKGERKQLAVPAVERARVAAHEGRTRVVLDGRAGRLPHYDVASTDAGLRIVFRGGAEPRELGQAAELNGVDFEQKDGFWRLKLHVTASATVRTVADGPLRKAILLEGVRAARGALGQQALHRGPLDAVVVTEADQVGDAVRVELRLSQQVEQSVWQKAGAVYWDLRPAATKAEPHASADRPQPRAAPHAITLSSLAQEGSAAQKYRGKKITIDMQDAEIENILRLIGDVSGKNVIVGDDVKGRLSLKLKNVPWDQALEVILKTKGLDMESRGGIIRVAPAAKIAAERAARLALAEERRQKVPTTVRLIPVNYAVASQLAPQIKELLSERGRVTFDQRTNVIIVEDIRDNLDQAERLVRTLDTQTPQVLIEARMVEASTDFTRSLGIQWGGGLFFSERGGNPTGLIFPNNVGIVGAADSAQAAQVPGILPPSNFAVNVPADGLTTGLGMNLGSIGNFGFLNARLTAAETTGQAKTITAPKVTTLDNRTARIFQGQQILVQVTTQNVINTTTVNAQLSLDVTPHVTADGSVLMNINLENNQPGAPVPGALPTINTKGATTELLVKDGDTAVIGGIYTRSLTEGYQRTPFLSQLPLLGWLFKSYRTSDSRSEMLVFLTPRIINRRSSTPMAQ